MDLYWCGYALRSSRRVTVYKTTGFRPAEMDGVMEAFHLGEAVNLIDIV